MTGLKNNNLVFFLQTPFVFFFFPQPDMTLRILKRCCRAPRNRVTHGPLRAPLGSARHPQLVMTALRWGNYLGA